MERIYTLIDKLSQQKAQGASSAHLLFTVQLLQHELLQLQQAGASVGSKKVAVTLPFSLNVTAPAVPLPLEEMVTVPVVEVAEETVEVMAERIEVKEVEEEKEVYVLEMEETEEEPVAIEPAPKPYFLQKPPVQELLFEEKPVVREEPRPVYTAQQLFNSAFETTVEVPTLAQYKSKAEVHEVIAEKKESLNDRLKQEKTEVAQLLKEAPIKDLRKGIGINDRFLFVRELFRGDEAMYERSIKTINGFNIYSEAEYWISRELKLKLGWSDQNETAQHFYHLVRRRFS